MSRTHIAVLRIAGLAVAWIVVAVGALILFGDAINAHSDFALAGAGLVAVAGLAALAVVTVCIVRIARSLSPPAQE